MNSFSKLNILSPVAFVAGSTKRSFVSLKTSLRWLCTFRFCKVSVTERMHALQSRSVKYSCKVFNCTWNLFSSNSWMKTFPLAAFNKIFSSLMFLLKPSWSNWSSEALMIQSKDSKYILQQWETTSLAYSDAAYPPKNSSILASAILFLDSGHKQKSHASLHPFVTALSHISASALPVPASELCSYITLDIGDYHNPFLKISP